MQFFAPNFGGSTKKFSSVAVSAAFLVAAAAAQGQVLHGLDDTAQDAWFWDPVANTYSGNFALGLGVRAMAYDPGTDTVYFSTGAQLYKFSANPVGSPILVGTISGEVTTVSSGLAYDTATNRLLGTSGTGTTHKLVAIDTTTAATTLVRLYGTGDFGGLDYNRTDGRLYGTNDSTSTTNGFAGRGLYAMDPPFDTGAITRIAAYPGSETDIDGCAADGDSVYLCRDLQNLTSYIYSLSSGTYSGPFTRPGAATTSEVFNGATFIGGGTPITGSNVAVSIVDPGDCAVSVGGSFDYAVTVQNFGPDPATGVEMSFTLPPGILFNSADGGATHSSGVVSASLGGMAPLTSVTININATVAAGGGLYTATASATSTSSDPFPGNNSDAESMLVSAVTPATASITGVFTTVAAASNSEVPEIGGLFDTVGGFDRPFVSADQSKFIISADTTNATTADNVLIVGDTSTGSFSVRAREGDFHTGAGELLAEFEIHYGVSNDGTRFAFSYNSAATTFDEAVVQFNGSAYEDVAREGINGPATPIGTLYGSISGSVGMAGNGAISFYSNLSGTASGTADDTAAFTNNGLSTPVQEGVTIPLGQGDATAFTVKTIDSGSTEGKGFYTNGDQSAYFYTGAINAPTTADVVAVLNDTVVLQEGYAVPGSEFISPISALNFGYMNAGGHWMAYGSNTDTQDWVVWNGTVVAKTDGLITPSASEAWDDGVVGDTYAQNFFLVVGNNGGDYVVGGLTNAPDLLANAALVQNGTAVIARENDPVDLDNNGLFDDDAFIRTFRDDRAFMTDTELWIVVRLRNGAGYCSGANADIGQALIRIPLAAGGCPWQATNCTADQDGDEDVDSDDIVLFFGNFENGDSCGDQDGDEDVDSDDIVVFFSLFEQGGC